MNKHTPEPWEIVPGHAWGHEIASRDTMSTTAVARSEASAEQIVNAFNNTYAAGINPEAVPGLLAAAKEAVRWMEDSGYGMNEVALRAAIAAAEEQGDA